MKLATWNLERGRSSAAGREQEQVLRDLGADIAVLTEPPASYASAPNVFSPAIRRGKRGSEPWVAIVGACIEPAALDIPFKRMAAAAVVNVDGSPLVVYGSVLPWGAFDRHAPGLLAHAGETAKEAIGRVLAEQKADIRDLQRRYPDHRVIWAGDFNQTVSGPNYGGSAIRREALTAALDELGLVAWNASAPHAKHAVNGMCAIDLICGPGVMVIDRQCWIDPVHDGVVMSDHAGYWVEFRDSR